MSQPSAIAIAAHPDDIEFAMAGTLSLLGEAGFKTHYLNIASGSCGSLEFKPEQLRAMRRREAKKAAKVLGAQFHPGKVDDLEVLYTVPLLRWLTGIIRKVRPTIVLTHSPQDYMEDHTNVCRLAVTATFARGMPNFRAAPASPVWEEDATVYHAMPHGLRDGLRRRIVPGAYVDTTSVQAQKLEALACHESQHAWLQASQGMNSYLRSMEDMSQEIGRMSGKFKYAEGWRRHSHMGFSDQDADPLRDALGSRLIINKAYERSLAQA